MSDNTARKLSQNEPPRVDEKLYGELFQRNWPLISRDQQRAVANLKLAVAGCGSTGGAFIDGALRLGVTHYKLADQGYYELNNLNRQMVDISSLNKNKAAEYGRRIKNVNASAQVTVYAEGLNVANIDEFLDSADFVFDAVDVTTASGMAMKLLLHEKAAARRLPVASALDLGFTQWLQSYDYRNGAPALKGQMGRARACKHPLKALVEGFCPIEDLPLEIIDEVFRLIEAAPGTSACQLGTACFLLAALVTPYILYFVSKNELPPLIKVDLLSPFTTSEESQKSLAMIQEKRRALKKVFEDLQ